MFYGSEGNRMLTVFIWCLDTVRPCAGSGVERIDPLRFLAGCKRQLNLSSLSIGLECVSLFIRASFCVALVCVCISSVSWLFWLSCQYLPSDWLERLPWRRLFVVGDYLHKAQAKDRLWLCRFNVCFIVFCVFVLSPGLTQYTSCSYGMI